MAGQLYGSPVHDFLVLQEEDSGPGARRRAPAPHDTSYDRVGHAHGRGGPSVAGSAAASDAPAPPAAPAAALPPSWRLPARQRTGNVVLVLCLNLGVPPPDVPRPPDCARMECWVDPKDYDKTSSAMADIARALESQYQRWQRKARYKCTPDPTFYDLRRVCMFLRRHAKTERVLFHYNGHGVPLPTRNGEIWVFSRDYTQYIPLALYDVQEWVGSPALYVFDCNHGGLVLNQFMRYAHLHDQEAMNHDQPEPQPAPNPMAGGEAPAVPMLPPVHPSSYARRARTGFAKAVVLVACGEDELLPNDSYLPADLFSCCLTTPIKTALHWMLPRTLLPPMPVSVLEKIPGTLTERSTPLGVLNWVFTAVTDTIAWNSMPREQFQSLFRCDLLLASLMRNFLLADRIMRTHGCTPMSHPKLPETHNHKLWYSFDITLEHCLYQMPEVIRQHNAEKADAEARRLAEESDKLYTIYERLFEDANIIENSRSAAQIREDAAAAAAVFRGSSSEPSVPSPPTVPPGFDVPATSAAPAAADSDSPSRSANAGQAVHPVMNGSRENDDLGLPGDLAGAPGYGGAYPGSEVVGHGVDPEQAQFRIADDFDLAASSNSVLQRQQSDSSAFALSPELNMMMTSPASKVETKHPIADVEQARQAYQTCRNAAKATMAQAKHCKEICTNAPFEVSPFFKQQLTAFRIWVDLRSGSRLSESLPIILQILLSQTHRVEALHLLSRYVERDPAAVDHALATGFLPYLEKFLNSQLPDVKKELVFISGKIVAQDASTLEEFAKMGGEKYFVEFLEDPVLAGGEEARPVYLVMALWVLSCMTRKSSEAVRRAGVYAVCQRRMDHASAIVRRWACLCLAKVFEYSPASRGSARRDARLLEKVEMLAVYDSAPDVRSSALALLSVLMQDLVLPISLGDSNSQGTERPSSLPSASAGLGSNPKPVLGHSPSSSERTDETRTSGGGTSGYEPSVSSGAGSFPTVARHLRGSNGVSGLRQSSRSSDAMDASSPNDSEGHSRSGARGAGGSSSSHEKDWEPRGEFHSFQRFARILQRASEYCGSVLVRREVAIALGTMANARLDLFCVGYQVYALSHRGTHYQTFAPRSEGPAPGSIEETCRDLYEALRRCAYDSHPIIFRHAHRWLGRIANEAIDSAVPETRITSGGSHRGRIVSRSPSHVEVASIVAPSASSAAPPSIVGQRSTESQAIATSGGMGSVSPPSDMPSSAGSSAVLSASPTDNLPPVPGANGSQVASSSYPAASSLAVPAVHSIPPGGSSTIDGPPAASAPAGLLGSFAGGHGVHGTLPSGIPAPVRGAGGSRVGDNLRHIRSGSGNIDLSRLHASSSPAGTGLSDIDAMMRRRSVGNTVGRHIRDNDRNSLPIYPVVLVDGLGQLIRSVSQTFSNIGRPPHGSDRDNRGRHLGRTGPSFGSRSSDVGRGDLISPSGPGLAGSLGVQGNPGVSMGPGFATGSLPGTASESQLTRSMTNVSVSSSPPHRRTHTSYQVLSKLTISPSRNTGARLPMPREGSFVVGPRGSGAGTPFVSSRVDATTAFSTEGSPEELRSLYEWSAECIPLLVFDPDTPHCMDREADQEDYGYHQYGYSFCAPNEDVVDLHSLHGNVSEEEEVAKGSLAWSRLEKIGLHHMGAYEGSILAIMFLPRYVGPGDRSSIVTGDSHGRVGVYDIADGKCHCQGSFGIPGPPGAEEAGVTAVLSLNTRAPTTPAVRANEPYEAGVLLAGAMDGRIAVFKSDLQEPKYSIVSTFQGSGYADSVSWQSHRLALGSLGSGQRSVESIQEAKDDVRDNIREHGNGLVLSYHSDSSTLAAGGCQGGCVRVWDLQAEKNKVTANAFPDDAKGVVSSLLMSWMMGDKLVAYGGTNGRCGLLDIRSRAGAWEYTLDNSILGSHSAPIVSMSICPLSDNVGGADETGDVQGSVLVSADMNGDVMLWDARMNGKQLARIGAHKMGFLTTMTTHPKYRMLVSGSSRNSIKLFDEDNALRQMVNEKDPADSPGVSLHSPVTSVAFKPEAEMLAVGCADSSVLFLGPKKGTPLYA